MAVLHFINKSEILCGTKAKTFKSTEVKELVTCKRCLKKLGVASVPTKKTKPKRKETKTIAEMSGRFVILTNKDCCFRFDMGPSAHFMFCTSAGCIFTGTALRGSQVKKNMKEKERKKMINIFTELKDDEGMVSGRSVLERFK
jgi:hypothetical protein